MILPVLPELRDSDEETTVLTSEYSSKDNNISIAELKALLGGASIEIERFMSGK
ncbi:MAG: hypothetical protein KBF83_14050 [Pyrinomonadaceae bacterium]|nr:hypothetical protein [Pyrinomonadaceae bacterium]